MKTSKLFTAIAVFMLFTAFTAQSQTKLIMIAQNDDSASVYVDTLNNAQGYAFFFDDEFDNLQSKLDSFMYTQRSNIDSVMKVMAIKMDSLQQNISMFSFDMDDDFFNNMMPSDSAIAEMMNINMDMKVEIDTLPDGTIVKNMVITGIGNGPGQKITISSDNSAAANILNKGDNAEEDVLSPIPVSDLHILKKAGFNTALFSEEPLEFYNENINIERKKTEKSDILEIGLKADLPGKGKTTVTLVDKNGSKIDQEKYKNREKINVKYKLDGISAPYYLVIEQNKKAWAKKIEF